MLTIDTPKWELKTRIDLFVSCRTLLGTRNSILILDNYILQYYLLWKQLFHISVNWIIGLVVYKSQARDFSTNVHWSCHCKTGMFNANSKASLELFYYVWLLCHLILTIVISHELVNDLNIKNKFLFYQCVFFSIISEIFRFVHQ